LRHDIRLEGYAFALRPVAEPDREFIYGLRSDAALNRFIHPTTAEGHARWLAEYFDRPRDYYFIVESRAARQPEGTVSVYNLDEARQSAEWGRWVLRRGSLAAIESAWLTYRAAFEALKLEMVYARTLRANERVIAFHDSCGCARTEDGGPEVLEQQMTRAMWLTAGLALAAKAARLARAAK
jgi:RimJ/RimL family protein N-acetyltransferase